MDQELGESFKKFDEALRLIDHSHDDPDAEPFKSRYAASELLGAIKRDLSSRLEAAEVSGDTTDEETTGNRRRLKGALALTDYYASLNYSETEEYNESLKSINEALDYLDSLEANEETTLSLHICCLNHLTVLKSTKEYHSDALTAIERSCKLFTSWRRENPGKTCLVTEHFLSPGPQMMGEETFHALHTTSLYLLAQVFKNLKMKQQSTLLCYLTLNRVSEASPGSNKSECDWVDWALNCATLSQCFSTEELYTEAKICLASSYAALDKFKAETLLTSEEAAGDQEVLDDMKEKISHCEADIDRCVVKYCINLLDSSWTYHTIPEVDMRQTYKPAIEHISQLTTVDFDVDQPLVRFDLFRGNIDKFSLTCQQARSFEDARSIFLFGQSKCNMAKLFYTEDTYCRDYIDLVRDHSMLFKKLACFEPSLERKLSMNKKRTSLLCEVLKDLNPVHYIQVIRQLQFEMAETYSDIADLQKDLLTSQKDVSVAAAKKINSQINKSIQYFTEFLDTFRDDKTKAFPEVIPDMYVRPVLMANFYMARLLSKLIAPPNIRSENVMKSGTHYKYVADYCDQHVDAKDQMKNEYPICQEMSILTDAKRHAIIGGANL